MLNKNIFRLPLLVAALSVVVSCGGSTGENLEHKFPTKQLAPVPPSKRKAEADAYKAFYIAKMKRDRARYELEEVQSRLRIAEMNKKKAALDRSIAKERQSFGKKFFVDELLKTVGGAQEIADTLVHRSKSEVEYLKARRDYLEVYIPLATEEAFAAEAKLEMLKVQLAEKNGIKAEDVSSTTEFQEQLNERNAQVSELKGDVGGKQSKAKAAEARYKSAK